MRRQSTPCVKGVAFRTVMKLMERHHGRSALDRAYAAMPRDVAEPLRGGSLLSVGWYAVEWYRGMWRAILDATGEGESYVRRVGREAIDEDLHSIYRPLVRMLSPHTLVTIGMRHFKQL